MSNRNSGTTENMGITMQSTAIRVLGAATDRQHLGGILRCDTWGRSIREIISGSVFGRILIWQARKLPRHVRCLAATRHNLYRATSFVLHSPLVPDRTEEPQVGSVVAKLCIASLMEGHRWKRQAKSAWAECSADCLSKFFFAAELPRKLCIRLRRIQRIAVTVVGRGNGCFNKS